MKRFTLYLILLCTVPALAQHDHHAPPADSSRSAARDTADHSGHSDMDAMSHSFSLHLPMSRNASGTGWLPDASPMYGYMIHLDKWMLMIHGNVFVRYNKQDILNAGKRGDEGWDAPNWLMLMANRKLGRKGLFHFSLMSSADDLITGGSGYPLLFQSGETWKGEPLVDRQHPHDLFSELSVSYAYSFTEKTDAFIYVGYPGEPASGSVAFMHRPSAMSNPDAPLSHHWNDGTHITFGVVTLGVRYDKFKLEASSFTGREPDENRYDFDRPRMDSRSMRLSYNPTENWAFQVSHAIVVSPEVTHPEDNVDRSTASVIYSRETGRDETVNVTALWGLNHSHGEDQHAALLEAAGSFRRFWLYGRYEWVQKSVEELNLPHDTYGHAVFGINAFTAGISFDLIHSKNFNLALGTQGTIYKADERLETLYGKYPMAAEVYLRLYPARMRSGNLKMEPLK